MRILPRFLSLLGCLLAAMDAGATGTVQFNGLEYAVPPGWSALEQDGRVFLTPAGSTDVDQVIVVLSPPRALAGATFERWFEASMAADLHAQARVISRGEIRRVSRGGVDMLTAARAVQDAGGESRIQMFNAASNGERAAMAMLIAASDAAVERHAAALRSLFESMRVGSPQASSGSDRAAQLPVPTPAAPSAPRAPASGPVTMAAVALPAGQYHCITTRWSPNQPIILEPSVLGRLIVDGRGTYRVSTSVNAGAYRLDRGGIAFESGPLSGWPALVETVDSRPRIRLGKTKDTPPNPAGASFGEHRCTLRE